MALSKTASLELYLSSDGTPIEAGATLAAQGIRAGSALDVVVSYPKVGAHRLTHACSPLTPVMAVVTHFCCVSFTSAWLPLTPVMVVISFFFLSLLTS